MGPAVFAETYELSARFDSIDAIVDDLFDGRMSRAAYLELLDDQQQRLQGVVAGAARLDEAVSLFAARRRAEAQATQRVGVALTGVLVLLALAAAALVARLGRGYRSLALRLANSETRFREIAENIHEFIWLSDPQFTTHYYVNAVYERIWGRTRESLYQDPMSLVAGVHPDDRESVRAALARLPEGEYDIEFRVVRPDGEVRWVWSRGFPVHNDGGEIYRIAGISEDVTDRKLAEIERQRLLERERAARKDAEEAHAEAEQRRK